MSMVYDIDECWPWKWQVGIFDDYLHWCLSNIQIFPLENLMINVVFITVHSVTEILSYCPDVIIIGNHGNQLVTMATRNEKKK